MSLLSNIRDAMADALDDAFPHVQVSANALSNPSPPAIQIVPGESARLAMGDARRVSLVVTPFVAFVDDIGSQQELDGMILNDPADAPDVQSALEANPTLGGLVDDLFVGDNIGYRVLLRPDNTAFLTTDFNVTVLT